MIKKSQTKYQNVFSQKSKVCPIIFFGHPNIIFDKKGHFRSHGPDFWPKMGKKTAKKALLEVFAHFWAKNGGNVT